MRFELFAPASKIKKKILNSCYTIDFWPPSVTYHMFISKNYIQGMWKDLPWLYFSFQFYFFILYFMISVTYSIKFKIFQFCQLCFDVFSGQKSCTVLYKNAFVKALRTLSRFLIFKMSFMVISASFFHLFWKKVCGHFQKSLFL